MFVPRYILVLLIGCILTAGLAAQVVSPIGGMNVLAAPYGSGQRPSLAYTGELTPSNMLLLSFVDQTIYDDNIFDASGPTRQADIVTSLQSNILLFHNGERITVAAQYLPYLQLYRTATQYNRFNQELLADVNIKASARWDLRVRESFTDQVNTYQPQLDTNDVGDTGSPTKLNDTIYAPLAPERDTGTRADAVYQGSARTGFAVFGAYEQRNFTGTQAASTQLLSTQVITAGAEYPYRLTEHGTLGALALFQQMNVAGALTPGSASTLPVVSALGSVGWRLAPTVSVNAFGGLQYIKPGGVIASPAIPAGAYSGQMGWAGGGTFTDQGHAGAVFISGQRMVSDGGGYANYVLNSSVDGGLRRRLFKQCDMTLDLVFAQNKGLGFGFGTGTLSSKSVVAGLAHPLRKNLIFRCGYNYARQTSSGTLPNAPDFNRYQIIAGISYQMNGLALGRQ